VFLSCVKDNKCDSHLLRQNLHAPGGRAYFFKSAKSDFNWFKNYF